jgi:hypothetical protein
MPEAAAVELTKFTPPQPTGFRRAVFFNRLREIRDGSYENQCHRASGLNLLVALYLTAKVYDLAAIDNRSGSRILTNGYPTTQRLWTAAHFDQTQYATRVSDQDPSTGSRDAQWLRAKRQPTAELAVEKIP